MNVTKCTQPFIRIEQVVTYRYLRIVRKTGGTVNNFGTPSYWRGMGIAKICENKTMDSQFCCCADYYGPNCDQRKSAVNG